MEKINILYLANTGDIVGGGEISLLDLLHGLNKEKFKPLVVCPFSGDLADEFKKLGIEIKIVKMGSLKIPNPVSFIRSVMTLVKILKNREIMLVHANGSRCAIYGSFACKIIGIPMIWHVRILESDGLLDRFLAKMSTVIIVNSKAVAERFKWLRNKSKIKIIYNGIDLTKFGKTVQTEKIRKEFGFNLESPIVATVGRLDWYKAHQYFLQAAKKIKEILPNVRFLIVGDGKRKSYLESLTKKLGLSENVVFAGNRRDIPDILECIDVFALSSISEGFGRSAVESMASEKPVVATRVGGLCEIVDDGMTGILVSPKDPTVLAKAVVELLKDKKKAKDMGIAGRKKVEKMFSIEKNVKKTEELYKKILENLN